MKHNCPNCGAPVYLDRRSCPYCETPYTIGGLITQNEARKFLGLPTYAEQIERLYDEALKAMRKYSGIESILYADDEPIAYSLPYYGVDGNLRLEMIE